jgi:hypothetical protein
MERLLNNVLSVGQNISNPRLHSRSWVLTTGKYGKVESIGKDPIPLDMDDDDVGLDGDNEELLDMMNKTIVIPLYSLERIRYNRISRR